MLFAWVAVVAFALIFTENEPLVWRAMLGLSCFFAGTITYLAYLLVRDRFAPSRWLMTVLECALMGVTYWMVMNDFSDRSPLASLMFCVLVLVFAFEAGLVSTFLKTGVFRLLGKLSYSIYMTHAALLFCLSTVFIVAQKITGRELAPMIDGQRFMDTGSELGNNVLVVAVTLAAIALAALAHQYIELKGVELGKWLTRASKAKVPGNVTQSIGAGREQQIDRTA
jgi:peptidoglycan/LPS O-acetylase OafA/YrhL